MNLTKIPDLPSVFRPVPSLRAPAPLMVGRWDLWDALDSSAQDYTALARSFLELAGPTAGGPLVRRQNLLHLSLLVRAGAPICWEAPLYTNRSDFAPAVPSTDPRGTTLAQNAQVAPSNPSLFAALAEAVELSVRAESPKSTKTGKKVLVQKNTGGHQAPFALLASVWKRGQAESGWSWSGPEPLSPPSHSSSPAQKDMEEPWESAVRHGLWSWLRLSPAAMLAEHFADPALTAGCLDQDWWVSFATAAAHRPDWADGRLALARRRGAAFWPVRSGAEALDWLRVAQGDLSAEPSFRVVPPQPPQFPPQPPQPFFWDRSTAAQVLSSLLQEPAQSVEKLAVSVTAGVGARLRAQSAIALVYASTTTRTQMFQSKAKKSPAIKAGSMVQTIQSPPPPGRGWALWDVLSAQDTEDLIITPGHHGVLSLVASECRARDIYGGTDRIGNLSGADAWNSWVSRWPMDRTPTAWLRAELAVVAAESQGAYRIQGAQPEFIPRVMVRNALSDELVKRLFRAVGAPSPSDPSGPISPPLFPEDASTVRMLFHAVLDAMSVSAAPGDFLMPGLIRSGERHRTSWAAAAQAAGGWPFADDSALQRLIDDVAPNLPAKGTPLLDSAGSSRAASHQDSRAFRSLTASLALAPLDDLVPHLTRLPELINRFTSGWSARARTDVALLFFLRAVPLPLTDPRRPHVIQAAWTAACLAATGPSAPEALAFGKTAAMPSFDVLADLERIFLRYGRPPLKNGADRRSVLGPFADPEAFRPLLRDAATAIMAAKTRRAKGKTSPMELEQVFLRLTAAATPSSAPVRQAAARRL